MCPDGGAQVTREWALAPGGRGSPTILAPAGGVAQLVERYVRNVEAEGSSPFTSTRRFASKGRTPVGKPRFRNSVRRGVAGERADASEGHSDGGVGRNSDRPGGHRWPTRQLFFAGAGSAAHGTHLLSIAAIPALASDRLGSR